MIVGVREDDLTLAEEAVHQPRPPTQILVTFFLQMSVPRRKLAAIPEPADIDEVRGRLLQPGHPRLIHQGESRPALTQQLEEVGANPTPMVYLDGVPWSVGQFPQESIQDLHALDGKVRRELE